MTSRRERFEQVDGESGAPSRIPDLLAMLGLRRRETSRVNAPHAASRSQQRCFALVRQERLVVGPTTMPYPINHETVLMTSDSVAELRCWCDRFAGETGGSDIDALHPHTWIDAVPGEKVFSYAIRRA